GECCAAARGSGGVPGGGRWAAEVHPCWRSRSNPSRRMSSANSKVSSPHPAAPGAVRPPTWAPPWPRSRERRRAVRSCRRRCHDRNVGKAWMVDEVAHAGPEHLDAAFVAGFDRKQGYPDPAEDLAALREHGIGTAATLVDLGAGTGTLALAAAPHVGRV